MSLETVHETFVDAAVNGYLEKPAFENCVAALMDNNVSGLSEQYRAFLSFAMSNIFLAYDRQQTGLVAALEVPYTSSFHF